MTRSAVRLTTLAVAFPVVLAAQNIHPTPPPAVRAVPLQGEIHLDGRLNEPIWQTAPAATGFRQQAPHEGDAATQRTEVRFVYDGAAIYVGARMYDDHGAAGVQTRLLLRDGNANDEPLNDMSDTLPSHTYTSLIQFNTTIS